MPSSLEGDGYLIATLAQGDGAFGRFLIPPLSRKLPAQRQPGIGIGYHDMPEALAFADIDQRRGCHRTRPHAKTPGWARWVAHPGIV